MEEFIKSNLERPYTTEYGILKNEKGVEHAGGITMWYCYDCNTPMSEQIGGYCSLCGKSNNMRQTQLTVKQLQQRSIKSKEGHIMIGHVNLND